MRNVYCFFAFIIMSGMLFAQTANNLTGIKASKEINCKKGGSKAVIDTLHYDGNYSNGIGTGAAGTYEAYAFFSATQLATYNSAGNTITSVDIYINGVTKVTSTTIKFRANQTSTAYTQAFTPVEGWNNVVLTTPFPIPATNLYIGYECVCIDGSFPLGSDSGPVNSNGNWIVYNSTWAHLTDLNAAMTYNWNIRARVDGTVVSNDATLSSLLVNGSSVPAFSPTTYNYNVVLPYGTTIMPVVTATTSHNLATKVITNVTSLPGSATVVVTAQDGVTSITYTINFTIAPANNDASLSDLKVDGITVSGFNSTTYNYNVELPYGTIIVPTVTAIPAFINASAQITNAPSLPGTTTILVTAEDGVTTHTYTINFTIATGIGNIYMNNIKVYPNPSTGEFKISNDSDFSFTITDITNRIIISKSNPQKNVQVNLKEFGSGTYFIQIKTNEKIYFYKIILQN